MTETWLHDWEAAQTLANLEGRKWDKWVTWFEFKWWLLIGLLFECVCHLGEKMILPVHNCISSQKRMLDSSGAPQTNGESWGGTTHLQLSDRTWGKLGKLSSMRPCPLPLLQKCSSTAAAIRLLLKHPTVAITGKGSYLNVGGDVLNWLACGILEGGDIYWKIQQSVVVAVGEAKDRCEKS